MPTLRNGKEAVDPRLFAEIADLLKEKYGARLHTRTNTQEITFFEETTGKTYNIEITQKRFKRFKG